jgi:hypothetical protein
MGHSERLRGAWIGIGTLASVTLYLKPPLMSSPVDVRQSRKIKRLGRSLTTISIEVRIGHDSFQDKTSFPIGIADLGMNWAYHVVFKRRMAARGGIWEF